MRDNLLLFMLFFTYSVNSYGQVDTTNIYYQALQYYNAYLNEYRKEEKEIFIELCYGITDKLPSQVEQRAIIILTGENMKKVYAKNNNKIKHVKIFPASTKGDLIEINFTPYFGRYKKIKNILSVALSDWIVIQFKFDCDDNKFKYWGTRTGGI